MPAHSCDLRDPKNVLRVLLALVIENGGELRLKAATYDTQDRQKLLTVDFDRRKSQIVIRATSDFGSVVQVPPESYQWSAPPAQAPLERARTIAEAEATRRAIPSDEDLADLEERAQKNRNVAAEAAEGRTPVRIRTVPPSKLSAS